MCTYRVLVEFCQLQCTNIKGPPSTDRLFDRLFLLWKFALLITAIWLDKFQLWLDFHVWKLFYGTQSLSVEGGPLMLITFIFIEEQKAPTYSPTLRDYSFDFWRMCCCARKYAKVFFCCFFSILRLIISYISNSSPCNKAVQHSWCHW